MTDAVVLEDEAEDRHEHDRERRDREQHPIGDPRCQLRTLVGEETLQRIADDCDELLHDRRPYVAAELLTVWEIFLLAVGSMFWPLLLAVDVLAFNTDRPVAILSGFLAGGLITTVAVGSVIVFSLNGTSLTTGAKSTTDASVDIVAGVAALAAAAVIYRRRPAPKADAPHRSSRVERLVARGGILAFAAGIVANVFPGVLPFVALKDIAELDYSNAATVLVIVGFYLVMFTFIEAPIGGYLVAPAWTARAVASFNAWLSRNLRTLACSALAIFGTFEVVRGIVAAA